MKKLLYILSIVGTVCLTSCDIETSDNGDFDGFWHLVRVDTLATSGSCDVSQKTVFWAVQYHLIQLRGGDRREDGGQGRECYLRFELSDDQLVVFNPHQKERSDDESRADPAIDDDHFFLLKPYGINDYTERFVIERLNSDEMVLKSATLRLHFYKM